MNFSLFSKKFVMIMALSIYEFSFMKSRIEMLMKETKANSLREYYGMLNNKEEFKRLLDYFAINKSSFFRDASVYEEFSKILSSLVEEKRKTKDALRIWSAGCTTGEEPYSIAILLKEKIKEIDFPFSIIATDIDEDALEKARNGVYEKRSIEQAKKEYIEHFEESWNKHLLFEETKNIERYMGYFREKETKYSLPDEIKNMVTFLHHDMTKDSISSCFDVIFCRNVLMYFNEKTKNKMFELFNKNLNEHGFLIVGKTEVTFFSDCRKFFYPHILEENIYRKERRKSKEERMPERRKSNGWSF